MSHADPPGHPIRPDSSGSTEEHLVSNEKAAGSTPARGSYIFLVVRKDFDVPNGLVQMAHALTESLMPWDLPIAKDTRMAFLGATKEELSVIRGHLEAAGIRHTAIVETDGALAGCVTAIGLLTRDRDALKTAAPLLDKLKRWKEPKCPPSPPER